MKKTYETPVCRAIIASDEDILTASKFTTADQVDGQGGFDDKGGVIYW